MKIIPRTVPSAQTYSPIERELLAKRISAGEQRERITANVRGVYNIRGGKRGSKGRWQVRLPASAETKQSWLRNSTP